ncbi:acyl-CoA synthetase (AMP-forming)/AMP-acid ligase II [Litorivivens lipolytica]|uniref:Acyl-CoA synthetase (AMP-forming)/AMP-acid ligase II n=1 Tax=Litorivivens lipolytica TaxID=1524264 RepID=A0A7W4W250_9GAMM|nr:long-chain-fatty-acid--CoA ligase [Litorivivens lipolytica]MBB3046045.1 acyl-CoA synthetase (AMP-forming)/AMP-acid ligase II [Litorivivens lipolytica]
MQLFHSLTDHLDYHALIRGDLLMARDAEQSLSYAQAKRHVDAIAGAMEASGIKAGDRVGILAKNSVDNLCTFLACARLGAVAVGLNYRLTQPEVEFIAEDAELCILFFDAEFAGLRGKFLQSRPSVCYDSSEPAQRFSEWLQQGVPITESRAGGDDILFQMYTSGTTGLPKGVLISHRNVLLMTYQAPMSHGKGMRTGEKSLLVAPTFHAVGLVGALLVMVYGSSVIIQREYDPVGMIDALEQEQINSVAVIPVMLQFSIICVPDIAERDFSHLHTVTYGASPIAEDLLRQCMEIFGCDFVQGYGQTEATLALSFLSAEDHRAALNDKPHLLRSCGRAVFGTEIRVVDDKGNTLPNGEIGEIVARGPQLMQGYWKREDATASAIVDGWLRTGDAGRMDDEGYIFIQDRVKDMIISGGENIYPAELENVLMSHPAIQDAAVIGIADEKWGEVPFAVLVSGGNPELSADELIEFCRDKLAGYKIPRQLAYVDALPRNPTGKLLKKDLREQFKDRMKASA